MTTDHAPSRLTALLATITALFLAVTLSPAAPAEALALRTGNDVSWPQCPKGMGIPGRRSEGKPMPGRTAQFVVVGLTNGPGFYPNPCLKAQVRWVRRHHAYAAAYAMTTYPTGAQLAGYAGAGPHSHRHRLGKLWNAGYAEAAFNVAAMEHAGLRSPIVWLDVEPYPVAPWSSSIAGNLQVVDGAVSGYQAAGYRVGFYSTTSMWSGIVGGARFALPEWHTAGGSSQGQALAKCSAGYSFQGGRAVITQWTSVQRDSDVLCPGYRRPATMRRWFHQY